MRIIVIVIALLAVSASSNSHAVPSKGKLVTLCKQQVKQTLGETGRIKAKKIKRKKITFLVKPSNSDARQTVVCEYSDNAVHLTKLDGTKLNQLSMNN